MRTKVKKGLYFRFRAARLVVLAGGAGGLVLRLLSLAVSSSSSSSLGGSGETATRWKTALVRWQRRGECGASVYFLCVFGER